MAAMMTRTWVLLVFCAAGCKTQLSRETIKNHPKINLSVFAPAVVERSAPIEPLWVKQPERGAVSFVAFTGQSFAQTLDAGKSQAVRDMLSAVSNFISVEVESEFDSVETSKTDRGSSEESEQLRSSVHTKSSASIEGIAPNEVYWEKVVASPLTPDNVSYRVFVHAQVPKGEITRARLKKQLMRQKKSGKTMVVVLPFRPVEGAPAKVKDALLEELSRRLSDAPSLYIGDPKLVSSLVDPEASEPEVIERLSDALLPDLIVSGSYQAAEGRLKVTYSVIRPGRGEVVRARSVVKGSGELFELEDELTAALKQDIAPRAGPPKGPGDSGALVPTKEASDPYYEAAALFQAGKNEAAIEKLGRAIALDPDFGRAHLRLGRVLERLGRYAKVPVGHQEASPMAPWPLEPCTEWSKISSEPKEVFLRAAEGAPEGVLGPVWPSDKAANIDHVLSAAAYTIAGGSVPHPDLGTERSAAAEYFTAFRIGHQKHDPKLERAALLALADLGTRVDRLSAAEPIDHWLIREAKKSGDLDLESLAHFGLGVIRRAQSRYDEAIVELRAALEIRTSLGEKPYLLEIYNELGGVMVETARYDAALAMFEKAHRIAIDLDQPYFRAVLSNNLGVLHYLRGRSHEAEREFNEAFEVLEQLDEAEGQLAAGLNLGHVGASKGDLERARRFLAETRRILAGTTQEAKLGLEHDHQGYLELVSGKRLDALRDLLRSWALYDRLGRAIQNLRLRNSVAAAEFYQAADEDSDKRSRDVLLCLRKTYEVLLERADGQALSTTSPLTDLAARLNADAIWKVAP
jgi:tetratricopeptide (TPR) repeat protein